MTHREISDHPVQIVWEHENRKTPGYLVRGSGLNSNYLYVIHNDPAFNGFDAGNEIKIKYGCSYSWQFESYNPSYEYNFGNNRFTIIKSDKSNCVSLEFKKPIKFSL